MKRTIADAVKELHDLQFECGHPDWDGDGAKIVSHHTINKAAAFIRALPDGIELPEFAPEPDGQVSIDWMFGCDRMFSISTGAGKQMPFAFAGENSSTYGVIEFNGKDFPNEIMRYIS